MDLELSYGRFLYEEKNRFICKVAIDDQVVECYVPSSCRLSRFADLSNRTVALRPNKSQNSRTKYALYAIEDRQQFVLVDQTQPNRIIESAIHSRRFSFLGTRNIVLREKTIDDYKCDLFLPESNAVLEIKSILAFERCAYFPAVYPQRGLNQLKSLLSLIDKGYPVYYFLVAMNPRIKQICFNGEYKDFEDLLRQCVLAGMVCKGFTVKLVEGRPVIHSCIPVCIGD